MDGWSVPTSPDGGVTNCPICLEVFKNPRALPCLHTFCFKCLDEMWSGKRPDSEVECPNCRARCRIPANGVAGFVHNFFISHIIEAENAAKSLALRVETVLSALPEVSESLGGANVSNSSSNDDDDSNNTTFNEDAPVQQLPEYDYPQIGEPVTPIVVRPPLPLPTVTEREQLSSPTGDTVAWRYDGYAEPDDLQDQYTNPFEDNEYSVPDFYETPMPPTAAVRTAPGSGVNLGVADSPPIPMLRPILTQDARLRVNRQAVVGQIPLSTDILSRVVLKKTGINLLTERREVPRSNDRPGENRDDRSTGNRDVPQSNDRPSENRDVPQSHKVPRGNDRPGENRDDRSTGNREVPQSHEVPRSNDRPGENRDDRSTGNREVPQSNDRPSENRDGRSTGNREVPQSNDRPNVKPKPAAAAALVRHASATAVTSDQISNDDLRQYPWFFENMNRAESETQLLLVGRDGTFVVRPSQHAGPGKPYALTVLYRSVARHVTIRQTPNGKYALGSEKPDEMIFNSISELISFHRSKPLLLTDKKSSSQETVLLDRNPPKP